MQIITGLLSLAALIGLGWLLSSSRKNIKWRTILTGLLIEGLFVYTMLNISIGQAALKKAALFIQHIIDYSSAGIDFVFGPLLAETGVNFVFAIHVLGALIFISALISGLYYLRILPVIVKFLGTIVGKLLKTSKVESFSAVGNTFLGVAEAPLLVKPYLSRMTKSETFAIMVGGTASASGAILVGYVEMGIDLTYLLIAIFSVPFVSLVMAKLLEPETEISELNETVSLEKSGQANVFEAISDGAVNGVKLAASIGGLMIAFISVIALVNGGLGLIGTDLSTIFGYLFYPFAVIIGIPFSDAFQAASLIGTKLAANEFLAYSNLKQMAGDLSPMTMAVMSVALCNFANLSSIGQLIVGLGSLAPEKQSQVARLGLKAIIGGTLASFITAVFVSMFL
ncbi:NupC/NupG family nucleoside CNT transporter [Halobacillus litoralis]|uniref:NupC/NupG family nucleoside CNT transporter n=1 Tax=Halobacillus litoralis TaxID=45668 RepID=A0A845DPZ5_9BACI|nr:nucleoside transporter C-terminal domain-containing protein [Halobacillus litoralis]MCA1023836.1 NupC/NupG family nucleoside CNT transporter [Halobacillus litoralis]MYL18625.1 NupC/NupG family nucleoside CNT transporter [Halobacillus litoralis]